MCGTPEFVSPEVVSYDYISPGTDMWSVGVVTYILLSGFSPFMGESDTDTFTNIVRWKLKETLKRLFQRRVIYDFDEPEFDPISAEAKDFISQLLMKNARSRLSAATALAHPWLAERPQEFPAEPAVLSTEKLRAFQVKVENTYYHHFLCDLAHIYGFVCSLFSFLVIQIHPETFKNIYKKKVSKPLTYYTT